MIFSKTTMGVPGSSCEIAPPTTVPNFLLNISKRKHYGNLYESFGSINIANATVCMPEKETLWIQGAMIEVGGFSTGGNG